MINYNRDQEQGPLVFKRVARLNLEPNKDGVVSYASNGTFSLTQFAVARFVSGGYTSSPIPGAIRLTRSSIINLMKLVLWVATRLPNSDVEDSDTSLMQDLREVCNRHQKNFESAMIQSGYPPTNFQGQDYKEFIQEEEFPRRNN